jgi:hypothetical protein
VVLLLLLLASCLQVVVPAMLLVLLLLLRVPGGWGSASRWASLMCGTPASLAAGLT